MQTFLPYPDFVKTARVLESKRLGKQRVEVVQILNALHEIKEGWRNHPCTHMWRGYEVALAAYGLAMCEEYARRGYKNTLTEPALQQHLEWATGSEYELVMPWWMGNEAFHLAHQSVLLRKDPDHYGPLFPGVPRHLQVFYPLNKPKEEEAE